jgi:hypothetical protein
MPGSVRFVQHGEVEQEVGSELPVVTSAESLLSSAIRISDSPDAPSLALTSTSV